MEEIYIVTIKAITDSFTSKFDQQNGVSRLTVQIDQFVPNAPGQIEVRIDGRTISFPVSQFAVNLDIPSTTDQIVIIFHPSKCDLDTLKEALPLEAKLFLDY